MGPVLDQTLNLGRCQAKKIFQKKNRAEGFDSDHSLYRLGFELIVPSSILGLYLAKAPPRPTRA